jgi:hypothetical protein
MEDNRDQNKSDKENSIVKQYQNIVDRAHREVEQVRSVYKWLAGSLAVIISVGIFFIAFFSYKNMSDLIKDNKELRKEMKDESRIELDNIKQKSSQEVASLSNNLNQNLEKVVNKVGTQVNHRIEEEFNKDNIKALVERKAQERIDKVADQSIERKISQKVTPKLDAVAKSADDLNNKYIDARDKVKQLTGDLDVQAERLKLSKLADEAIEKRNRSAYFQLKGYAKDSSYPVLLRLVADAEWTRASNQYVTTNSQVEKFSITYIGVDNVEKINQKIPTSILISYLHNDPDWKVRAKAAQLLGVREEKGVPESLIEALQDDNLDVVREALDAFGRITDFDVRFFDLERPKQWWEQNKDKINNKLKEQGSIK